MSPTIASVGGGEVPFLNEGRRVSIFGRQRKRPWANYVSPAAADAFPNEEYRAPMSPTDLLNREIAEARPLGVESRKETPAQFERPPVAGSQWP